MTEEDGGKWKIEQYSELNQKPRNAKGPGSCVQVTEYLTLLQSFLIGPLAEVGMEFFKLCVSLIVRPGGDEPNFCHYGLIFTS